MYSSLGQMTSRNVHVDLLSCTQALDRWLPDMFMLTYCHALKPWTDDFQKCSCRPIVMHSSLGQMTSRNVHVDLLSCIQALDRWLPEMFMKTYCHALKPWTDDFQECSCRPIVMYSSLGQMASRNVHVDILSYTQALDRWLPEMFM